MDTALPVDMEKNMWAVVRKQNARRGRTQFESLVLVGVVAIGGAASFERFGESSEVMIADMASSSGSTFDAPPDTSFGATPPRVGSTQQAGALSGPARLARTTATTPINYGEVPNKLPRFTHGDWRLSREFWASRVAEGDFDRADLVAELTRNYLYYISTKRGPFQRNSLVPGGTVKPAELFAATVFDIRESVGRKEFRKAVQAYADAEFDPNEATGAAALLEALENATREGALRPTIDALLERAAEDAPVDLVERVRAVTEIFFGGIDDARRHKLFRWSGKNPDHAYPFPDPASLPVDAFSSPLHRVDIYGSWSKPLADKILPRMRRGFADFDDVVAELVGKRRRIKDQAEALAYVIFRIAHDVGVEGMATTVDYGLSLGGKRRSPVSAAILAAELATRKNYPNDWFDAAFVRAQEEFAPGRRISQQTLAAILELRDVFWPRPTPHVVEGR